MSWSKEQNKQQLQALFGVEFPDALFWLHEFLVECRENSDRVELSDLQLHPSGVLDLLLSFNNVSDAKLLIMLYCIVDITGMFLNFLPAFMVNVMDNTGECF